MISTLSLNSPFQSGHMVANMGRQNAALQHSTHSISSGKALLKAADDVAAMAIGTTYRGKVAQVRDAFMNIQKSFSLLDVADGGMQQINDMLDRMHGLSSMAQSDALSEMDRSFLDIEYKQLSADIDRIANRTKFGQINLLNGGGNSSEIYLLSNETVQRSSSLELLGDYNAATIGDLDIGSVAMSGIEHILGDGRSMVDLLKDTLNASDISNLQSGLISMLQSIQITVQINNVRMSSNGFSMESTTLKLDITSRMTMTAGAIERIADGDISFLQELAFSAVSDQLRGMSFLKSNRALLKLHSGTDGQGDILFATADATLKRLFGDDVGSLLSFDSAKQALDLTGQALNKLTLERARVGSARQVLEFEAAFLQQKMISFSEIRALHEDTNITKATTQFAIEQVQIQASIAVLTQTMRMHEDAVSTLYEKSWR